MFFIPHWCFSWLIIFIFSPKKRFSAYVDYKKLNLFKLEMYIVHIPDESVWFYYVVYFPPPILLILKSWLGNVWNCWMELLLFL